MSGIFSHIVRKHLSQENENVATEALGYVLESSDAARAGMTKFVRALMPGVPELWFRTQQMEGDKRPDMWGLDANGSPHVFVENKFWAGLTDNQPVGYLKKLAALPHQTLLLFVVPATREGSVWRELVTRLGAAGLRWDPIQSTATVKAGIVVNEGPILALTTWSILLTLLDAETAGDPGARNDLDQLRALCAATESEAFHPFSKEELSDHRYPSLILQLTSLVKDVSDLSFEEKVLFRDRLSPQADATRVGRYANILSEERCGVWLGIHFGLWQKYGQTPFWLVFSTSQWSRAREVRNLLEPWASQSGILVAREANGEFVVGIVIPNGEEKAFVVRNIVEQIRRISAVLDSLPSRSSAAELTHESATEGDEANS